LLNIYLSVIYENTVEVINKQKISR
jgi:hypothetical protein